MYHEAPEIDPVFQAIMAVTPPFDIKERILLFFILGGRRDRCVRDAIM
jgi:hypothetical protein